MTQNKRIVLNTVATYGRSMFGVLCGIFSTRWALEALGQDDFGLYAVVGGLAIFIGFFNIQLAGAITRFYAYSIGQAKVSCDSNVALLESRSWFTTAVVIHTIVPFVLVAVGWPLGIYAINNGWIYVPSTRIEDCLWVWRIVCISTLLGMVSVPFQAMYTAKQYIAELTVYSLAQTIAKTGIIYYMTITRRDWLVYYAFAMGLVAVVPQFVICVRACLVFKECRVIPSVVKEFNRVKQVASYAIWTAFGGIGYIASHQCMGILLNNFYGPRVAGGFGVAQTVSGEAASLTGALQGAFQPAIATSYGAGELENMRRMAFCVCKVGTVLTLMFAIPMALEIDELLRLWLKNVPPYAEPMSLCALAFIIIEKLSCGHISAVNASGRIVKFQVLRGILRTLVIPFAVIPAYLGLGPVAAMLSLPISVLIVDVGDALLARTRVGMSVRYWITNVVAPIIMLVMVACLIGWMPRLVCKPSIWRIAFTTCVVIVSMVPCAWFIVLSKQEREWVKYRMRIRCR